jgi:hypothetical protein
VARRPRCSPRRDPEKSLNYRTRFGVRTAGAEKLRSRTWLPEPVLTQASATKPDSAGKIAAVVFGASACKVPQNAPFLGLCVLGLSIAALISLSAGTRLSKGWRSHYGPALDARLPLFLVPPAIVLALPIYLARASYRLSAGMSVYSPESIALAVGCFGFAVIREQGGKDRLEYPIGTVLIAGSEPGRASRCYVQSIDGGAPRAVTHEGTRDCRSIRGGGARFRSAETAAEGKLRSVEEKTENLDRHRPDGSSFDSRFRAG